MDEDDRPESVEEAGALLGATITRCGHRSYTDIAPPKGMHSSFTTVSSVPSSELLVRLYNLRALLRSDNQKSPLMAAPSLLAVLMKLLPISTSLAAKNAASPVDVSTRVEIPPMLSNPLRKLWVECVVLCHRLAEGLSGKAGTDLFGFIRNMIGIATLNPKSGKAAGGARIAAMDVLEGLFDDDVLAAKLSSWAFDILQLCVRALRSSGNGEPSFRISAMRTACSVAKGCRTAQLKLRPVQGAGAKGYLVLIGALEVPAIQEAIKVLKQATADKYPEVRTVAATFAGLLAPLLIIHSKPKSYNSGDPERNQIAPTVFLDDVMNMAMRNIDDEQAEVASGWAEALARCTSTAVAFGQQKLDSEVAQRNVEAEDEESGGRGSSDRATRKKKEGPATLCATLEGAVEFFVSQFVKVGGELSAGRAGGTFSVGGRAVRIGYSRSLAKLLRIQSNIGGIGEDGALSMRATIELVLEMVGDDIDKQIGIAEKAGTPAAMFGSKRSPADAGLVRLGTSFVMRNGLSEMASEPLQLGILHELISLISLNDPEEACNSHQLQVALVEVSHLLTALGDSAASSVEEIVENLQSCLVHEDQGVRHEAAIACASLTSVFPSEGRKLLQSSAELINSRQAKLVGLVASGADENDNDSPKKGKGGIRGIFRRGPAKKETSTTKKPNIHIRAETNAIHGTSLMISLLVRDLPRLPGGISTELLGNMLEVAETLVSTQFNDIITSGSPATASICVRAGFRIITGVLTSGPQGAPPHIAKIFNLWQKSYNSAAKGVQNFTLNDDLSILDAVLSSIVAFLSHCSELLLSIPDALSKISIILEELLALFLPDGRFGPALQSSSFSHLHQSAKASLLEAFAWLPSGSFPMASDSVFSFSAQQIRTAIEREITCSILPSLVSKEDLLLDAKSMTRADRVGQVGGAKDIEEGIVMLTSDAAQCGEREAVLHFLQSDLQSSPNITFRSSQILGLFAYDVVESPPTALHEVGTWRKPVDPSSSADVRLLDAAIQAFSATFGLKDGLEQQGAMEMLETLVPPFLAQLSRVIGMNTALAEQTSRAKGKEDNSAVANITAVLLACLKALPLHEATHNVAIGLGPPWMNKAKDLLLTLLPSASNIVRRAAAEGLALLATLGVSEDAHFLQSTVLHSLDEVMQGNQPDGKPRTLPLEPVSASRAGSLLTLACIQRTTQSVSARKRSRTRGRALSSEEIRLQAEEELPTLQMMTRILPSAACSGFRDYFIVQTHALHAFGLLLGYSERFVGQVDKEDIHLLRKAVELVEENFLTSWTVAYADFDGGQEGERLATEASFLAVLLRLMTLIAPSLRYIKAEHPTVASRFSCMATIILECLGSHPVVAVEGMAFFEVLSNNPALLPRTSANLKYTENPVLSCIPYVLASITPNHPDVYHSECWRKNSGCLQSTRGLRAVIHAMKAISLSAVSTEKIDLKQVACLLALLEETCTTRSFAGSPLQRPLAAPRATELVVLEAIALEKEITDLLHSLLYVEYAYAVEDTERMLRWILFCRSLLLSVAQGKDDTTNEDIDHASRHSPESVSISADKLALEDTAAFFIHMRYVRWQVKSVAVQLASSAVEALVQWNGKKGINAVESPDFNHDAAVRMVHATNSSVPISRLVFHLSDMISIACVTSTAAVDQAELPILQEGAIVLLSKLVGCFRGIPDPAQREVGILDQYSTQIFSSVKHALTFPEETDGDAAFRRFLAGCEALQMVVSVNVATDAAVVKRITRPSVPSKEETQYFEYDGRSATGMTNVGLSVVGGMRRSALLLHVGRVWTVGKLLCMERQLTPEAIAAIKGLVHDNIGMAVHAAAIAVDGCRLLTVSGMSLCGYASVEPPMIDDDRYANGDFPVNSGFLYNNPHNIDDYVKASMAKAWSASSCFALRAFVKHMSVEELDAEKRAGIVVWLNRMVEFLFEGVNDAFAVFGSRESTKGISWSLGIDPTEVAVNCLNGLSILLEDNPGLEFEKAWLEEIEATVGNILTCVLMPCLGVDPSVDIDDEEQKHENGSCDSSFLTYPRERQQLVLVEACNFLKLVSESKNVENVKGPQLLLAILTPLDLLQRQCIAEMNEALEIMIATCLASASSLISLSKVSHDFTKAMAQVVLDVHSMASGVPAKIIAAAGLLLEECLKHENAINTRERRRIAHELAKAGDWQAWSVVCRVDDGLSASDSISVLQAVLRDSRAQEKQLEALAALRQLVQPTSAGKANTLVGRMMKLVGADVLYFLKSYGASVAVSKAARTRRTAACADSIKIVLLAFQQLVADGPKEQLFVGFLTVVFEHFLLVIRYNGLPNYPQPQSTSDATLGRVTAQAILHIARTAPVAFKSTLVQLREEDRTLVEHSVRAEMTGYVSNSTQAPAKKKLSLKGFKK